MPELPEVETIKRSVAENFINAEINDVIVRERRFRIPIRADLAALVTGAKIISLGRIAKYMLMRLNNGNTLIWHFGMSGKIKIESNKPKSWEKHDHVIFNTSKGYLIFNDTRRFGLLDIYPTAKLTEYPMWKKLGKDPWDKALTVEYLKDKFKNKKTAVKTALLDQEIICGIGNIYASEILYLAGVLPFRKSESLNDDEIRKIIEYTRIVLEEAIKAGGSTIHDYKRPDGNIGYFQEKHCVYDKTGLRCPKCCCNIEKTGGIVKVVLNGRSTFYCPTLQK